MAPWADHVYGADADWWNLHFEQVKSTAPQAKLWSQHMQNGLVFNHGDEINIVQSCGGEGLRKDRLVRGLNSGYQAINLAFMAGHDATRIILLGYDMKGVGTHFFGKHPKPLRNNTNYNNFLSSFNRMRPEEHGIEVINCSPDTALTCFPRMSLDEALRI